MERFGADIGVWEMGGFGGSVWVLRGKGAGRMGGMGFGNGVWLCGLIGGVGVDRGAWNGGSRWVSFTLYALIC